MKALSHSIAYQVLLLQASDEGRGSILFGESVERARDEALPFLVGEDFPSIYLEHPLVGDPFLDVTVLLGRVGQSERIASPAAGRHAALFDWFAESCNQLDDVSFGFELDTKEDELPVAAVHFQPRTHLELVRPFCECVGEPERADLYLDLANRMPEGWPLSFFGLFRGRPDSPLRVCGYLADAEKVACAQDPGHLASVFESIGFRDYDGTMLAQVSALMAVVPGPVDFQFDVYPDGKLGSVFAIDAQFDIEQPEAVRATFETGPGADVMELLQGWGAADSRWRLAIESAFARAIPVKLDDGEMGRFAFTLMPTWAKARWKGAALQPAKLYHHASASLLDCR